MTKSEKILLFICTITFILLFVILYILYECSFIKDITLVIISIPISILISILTPMFIRKHEEQNFIKKYSLEGSYQKYSNTNELEKVNNKPLVVTIGYLGNNSFEIIEEFAVSNTETTKATGSFKINDIGSGIASGFYQYDTKDDNGIYTIGIGLVKSKFNGKIWIGWQNLYPNNQNCG